MMAPSYPFDLERAPSDHARVKNRTRRVVGYARVSSQDQALGTSLRDQQDSIRGHAARLGLKVDRIYVEAESAVHEKIERREQIQSLLRDVRNGDLVLCDKLDRWSRDPEFTYRSVREILAAGASFYAISEACDPSTPDGDTSLGFRILFAREEHKRIKERMVGTRRKLRDLGYYVEGLPPMGYRRAAPKGHKGLAKNVLVVVPDEAAAVARLFRRYIAGESMTQLADRYDLKLDRVKDALHRRLYIGEIQNTAGTWIRGKHDPIVDVATFQRVQDLIAERRYGGTRTHAGTETDDWMLRDVARCRHCTARMGAAYAGPAGKRRYYYRCTKMCLANGPRANTRTYVPVRTLEAEVAPLIEARLTALREQLATPYVAKADAKPVDFTARRKQLDIRRARLLKQHEMSLVTDAELRTGCARLDAERLRLAAAEDEHRALSPLASATIRQEMLRDVTVLRQQWRNADGVQRRAIASHLLVSIGIAVGLAPRPKWRSAEDLREVVKG